MNPRLLIVAPLLLTACNLAPTYTKPSPKLPAEFKTSGPWRTAKPSDHESRGTWWKLFGDSRLNALMKEAETSNASLDVMRHRLTEAKALARADRASLWPTLDLLMPQKRNRGSGNISHSFSGGRTITKLHASLDASYELDFWGRVHNSVAASEAVAEAAEADVHNALLSLQGEVALNYFALRAQDDTIALLKRTMEVRRKAVELARARFKQGDTTQLDVAQAETELASTESEAIGLEKKRHQLEHALALLLGKTPSEFNLPATTLPDSPPSIPRSVPGDLLQRRPDIASAERQMAALNAEIGVAKAALYPSITLGLSGGFESSFIDKLANSASRVWGLGPDIDFPILDGGKNRANIDAAKARYDAAAATYRDTVLKAVREVEDALSDLEVLARQRTAQNQTIASARKTVELAQKRYDAGLVAFYEVLDAQRTLLHAEQEGTAISSELFTSTVLLIKSLGGGW